MKIETGDYVEYMWDEHYGVILHVERKPLNMGEVYTAVNSAGEVHTFEHDNFTANFGATRSQRHQWTEGQQRQYNSLVAEGRRLYDQIRTRLWLDHDTTYRLVIEHLPEPFKKF